MYIQKDTKFCGKKSCDQIDNKELKNQYTIKSLNKCLQALNQLFEKIIALDIEERHLLRLGHGEEALETEKDFSRYGRVNFILAKRLELLQVQHT